MNGGTRRDFLGGRFTRKRRPPPVRPPWALPEETFTARCTRCAACREACPEEILIRGRNGFPEVDFRRGECTFCGDCARACEAGVLRAPDTAPWAVKAQLTDSCLALGGVVCQSCADVCEAQAIAFGARAGGVSRPAIDSAACRGCGACVSQCPVAAIVVG